jgi:hypothetical protein
LDRAGNLGSGGEGGGKWHLTAGERALMGAQGKVLTLLLTALQSRGLLDAKEFAGLLGIFSVTVFEDDELQGDILAVWAGMMQEIP